MTNQEAERLIQLIVAGEDAAFESFMRNFRISVMLYLRRFVRRQEDVDDLLQETFLSAYQAIRGGRYTHINAAALAGWLRKIAWHALIHRSCPEQESTSEEIEAIPNGTPGIEERVVDLQLYEFLNRQFEEVLMQPDAGEQDRTVGLLKKMAFLHFYIDGLSQRETVAAVREYAERTRIPAQIDQTTVNNWISRGDILKLLVQHLVDQHRDLLHKLAHAETRCTTLSAEESRILHLSWSRGLPICDIVKATGLSSAEVAEHLRNARDKVAKHLFRQIKSELHQVRCRGKNLSNEQAV